MKIKINITDLILEDTRGNEFEANVSATVSTNQYDTELPPSCQDDPYNYEDVKIEIAGAIGRCIEIEELPKYSQDVIYEALAEMYQELKAEKP